MSYYTKEKQQIINCDSAIELKMLLIELSTLYPIKVFTNLINKNGVRENIQLLIRTHKQSLINNVYDFIYDIKSEVTCECGKIRSFKSFSKGYNNFCANRKCSYMTLHKNKKAEETFLEKYNGHPMKTEVVKTNHKNSMLNSYGFDNIAKYRSSVGLQKLESKFGSDDVKAKIKNTFLKKYNGHPMQNDNVYENNLKSRLKFQTFKTQSGREMLLQGFEKFAIKFLLDKYREDDIISDIKSIHNKTGFIYYNHDNKIKKYYPDFFIKSINKIYEVKSIWTYNNKIEVNKLKEQACRDKYLEFEFLIFNSKGERINLD